jgi:hypothetical protein
MAKHDYGYPRSNYGNREFSTWFEQDEYEAMVEGLVKPDFSKSEHSHADPQTNSMQNQRAQNAKSSDLSSDA